jgi:hypothetical protein
MEIKSIKQLIEVLKNDPANPRLLLKPTSANKDVTAAEGSWKASVFPHTDVPKGFYLLVHCDGVDRTALEVMDIRNLKSVSIWFGLIVLVVHKNISGLSNVPLCACVQIEDWADEIKNKLMREFSSRSVDFLDKIVVTGAYTNTSRVYKASHPLHPGKKPVALARFKTWMKNNMTTGVCVLRCSC